MRNPVLLPNPRSISFSDGELSLSELAGFIALNANPAATLFFTGLRAQAALKQYANVEWDIAGGDHPAPLTISVDASDTRAQSYSLSIHANGIQIIGTDLAGAFYGVCTLTQLLQNYGATLPLLEITDTPEIPVRGVMLDISRDKVPTMETLYRLVDMLASWKMNQFQLYTEHTFAYRKHQVVWEKASPITAEEILALDAYCRERYIDLVPNQASIGHMQHWFMHKEYLAIAETEEGLVSGHGDKQEYPFSLSLAVPETMPFLEGLYDELLPNFTSKLFNIGADETFDLGQGRSKALLGHRGKGGLYLDFLLQIYQRVKQRGRTMQFWGDILIEHPELVPEVPKDTIALAWNYDSDSNLPEQAAIFAKSGIPFYICPGTSSWTSIAGRTDNMMGNLRIAVESAIKHGAIGVLVTDWGDLGHWQQTPISYQGLAYAAALSWAYEPNVSIDLPAVVSNFAFHDQTGVMGKLAYLLGNAYQKPGVLVRNGSFLMWIYHFTLDQFPTARYARWLEGNNREALKDRPLLTRNLHETINYIDEVMADMENAQMQVPDADIIKREFGLTARMLKHGAKRALLELEDDSVSKESLLADMDEIITIYRQNWLTRNRPGGLDDSAARLLRARQTYTT